MLTRARFLIPLAAFFLLAGTALAQGGVTAQGTDPSWHASYWNNMTLSGPPTVQRNDDQINFNWSSGSPDPAIAADHFSARWTRYFDVAAGTYQVTATSDDGIRVWVDNSLVIDMWYDHPVLTRSATVNLPGGHHLVTVEYYENGGGAVAQVGWGQGNVVVNNWRGEYFNNRDLSGGPALVRDDASIDFNWGNGSPAPNVIGSDNFSVRWTRTLDLPAGSYRFTATADDGVRLWVNGHPLIDAWRDQPATAYTGDIYVPGGGVSVRMEYYEHGGGAVARLTWQTLNSQPGPGQPGEVIVDDGNPGFVRGGLPSSWRRQAEGYAGDLTWTKNNTVQAPGYNWARWYPKLSPRNYEVFVYIPERYSTTSHAVYWVSHANGFASRVVDQSANGSRWVSLGTYAFRGTPADYVSLNDITGEPYLSRLIAWDAVKWVPR